MNQREWDELKALAIREIRASRGQLTWQWPENWHDVRIGLLHEITKHLFSQEGYKSFWGQVDYDVARAEQGDNHE